MIGNSDFSDNEVIPESEPESSESAEGWLKEHPEDQQHITFDLGSDNKIDLPLFRNLDPHEEQEFRAHARETYQVGMPIDTIFHPVWQDEARKMNNEVAESSGASPEGT